MCLSVTKIDCHTHIVNEEIRREYFSRTDGIALVMQFPESILENPDCVKTVLGDSRLFLCPCIDIKQPIEPQLAALEPDLDRHKVVGLKIYLSYQAGRANDPKLDPVYAFAQRHQLSVTFHTGFVPVLPRTRFGGLFCPLYRPGGGTVPRCEFYSGPYGRPPLFGVCPDCGDPRQPVYRCLRCL